MNHKIIRTALALVFVSLLITSPRAQQPAPIAAKQSPEDRTALYQALLDLTNPWTVMCVAAHPDDEDGTSLIVMRRKYGAHTVSLFSTFGEGGQNAIGPELYEELGAIRARETMAAAEIQGSEPHFLGLKDFGYSKSADEAFKFWGHEEALRRMVVEIRRLRPDVIITNHSATSNDHGHHQATARLELEAFDAAADPKRFPEQLKDGVTTWQVQRLFVRQRGNPEQLRGGVTTRQPQSDNAQIVTIDPNERDPIRDTVFAEEALRALQKHATQGPWPKSFAEFAARFRAFTGQSAAPGQLPLIRYRLVREGKGAEPLPQDSHNFLDGLKLSAAVAQELPLPDLTSTMDALNDPSRTGEKIIETYREGWNGVGHVYADSQRRELMRGKIERAAALATGVHFSTQQPAEAAVANTSFNVPIRIMNGGPEQINGLDCWYPSLVVGSNPKSDDDTKVNHSLTVAGRSVAPGAAVTLSEKIQIPGTAKINVPLDEHLYEQTALGLNQNIRCTYEIDKTRIGIDLPVRFDVAPQIEIAAISPSPFVVQSARTGTYGAGGSLSAPPNLHVKLINHLDKPFKGALVFGQQGRSGFTHVPMELAAHQQTTLAVSFTEPDPKAANYAHGSTAVGMLWVGVRKAASVEDIIERRAPIIWVNARVASDLRVGYIRGFDYSLPNALGAMGVESKELSVDEVKTADLQKYTSVIVDNRVYESKPELIAVNQKLLDYANAGGNLIVFYHKSDEWNPDERRKRPQLAPYKLILGNERITDENAPISFLEPDHPLLNTPNKMGQDDFKDWIQERGLYYPKDWDPQFHALLQSNDPSEAPLKGGLLVADYGRGHYIYSSMVWYRELRGGIPGAYRMLANMISYGRN